VHFSQKKSDFDPTRKYLILSIANLRKVTFLQTQRLKSGTAVGRLPEQIVPEARSAEGTTS